MPTDLPHQLMPRPRGVILIAAILVLEALVVTVLTVLSVGTMVSGDAVSIGGSAFMAVLLACVAAALTAMAVKLLAGFRWPRSPTLVVQVFLVILAFPYFSTGTPLLGVLFLVPAATVIITLFSKPVVRFTARPAGSGRTL